MSRFDTIILGGGPAGSATAIRLARSGLSVVLFERSQYRDWRVGETLPPEVRTLLGPLGVWERFTGEGHLECYAIHSAWGRTEQYENDFIYNKYGLGWHVDRRRFDEMLAQAAEEAGAAVWRGGQAAALRREAGTWQLTVAGSDSRPCAQAPVLVDATGRSAWGARAQGSRPILWDRLIGVVGLLPPATAQADPILLLEAVEFGWWYSAPLPNGGMIASFMTDGDILSGSHMRPMAFWKDALAHTTHTAERIRDHCVPQEVRIRPASTRRLEQIAGPGWLAAGDAASTFDPLSGTGIAKALQEGMAAADAIVRYLGPDSSALATYAAEVERDFDKHLETRAAYYGQERRWPRSVFWERRQYGAYANNNQGLCP